MGENMTNEHVTLAPPVPTQRHTLSVPERAAWGKSLRQRCLRQAHADWRPSGSRADPIDLLIENSLGRVETLVPIRYGRMLTSPFAFYRGTAALMAHDLAATPDSGVRLQACGDCHLLNFGGFATPERKVIFDINDFDETSIAPWEWDVKRLAASFVIAGQTNGFKPSDCHEAGWLAAQSYRLRMAEYAGMSVLEAWYDAIDLVAIIDGMQDKDMQRFYRKKLEAAQQQSAHEKEFARLAHAGGRPAHIIDQPPLIFHYGDIRDEPFRERIQKSFQAYKASLAPELQLLLDRYEVEDVAFKVVGVGSVGTNCGIGLLMSGNGDPLFLQFKEARPSVLERYAGTSPYATPAERVVAGQRLMQAASDMFLGWARSVVDDSLTFYVRQLRDAKIKPVVEIMRPSNLKNYARLCGHALARAHTRSGDAVALSSYMGKSTAFEDAMAIFAVAYARQNEQDYVALVGAVRGGRVQAATEER
jgi:uncharacterized protein (DUF2252 family)